MVKWFIGLLLFFVFFSCKKEEMDAQPPIISLLQPLQNQSFNVFDTIHVQGIVKDNNALTSITISLRNSNNINVLNSISITPNSISYNLNEQFLLNDLYLPSGTYTLKISAFDGINPTDKYIPLTINEVPTIRNGLFVFSNSGTINQVSKLTNSLIATNFSTSTGDFIGGLVNSHYQEVFVCPSFTGNFTSYDVATANSTWNLINTASGLPNFTGVAKRNNEIFVAYYNGYIKSYFNSSTPNFNAISYTNSYARQLYVHENNLLITEQSAISGGKIRLVSYYLASGAIKDNVELNEDVVSMFGFSANEVAVFTNLASNGRVKIYNINSNSTWQPFALSNGKITSCTEISKGIFLLAQNGDVKIVNLNNFTNGVYLSGINAELVKCDVITNEVVVTSGNTLTVYDYSTKSVKGNYIHSNTILTVDFWYNK